MSGISDDLAKKINETSGEGLLSAYYSAMEASHKKRWAQDRDKKISDNIQIRREKAGKSAEVIPPTTGSKDKPLAAATEVSPVTGSQTSYSEVLPPTAIQDKPAAAGSAPTNPPPPSQPLLNNSIMDRTEQIIRSCMLEGPQYRPRIFAKGVFQQPVIPPPLTPSQPLRLTPPVQVLAETGIPKNPATQQQQVRIPGPTVPAIAVKSLPPGPGPSSAKPKVIAITNRATGAVQLVTSSGAAVAATAAATGLTATVRSNLNPGMIRLTQGNAIRLNSPVPFPIPEGMKIRYKAPSLVSPSTSSAKILQDQEKQRMKDEVVFAKKSLPSLVAAPVVQQSIENGGSTKEKEKETMAGENNVEIGKDNGVSEIDGSLEKETLCNNTKEVLLEKPKEVTPSPDESADDNDKKIEKTEEPLVDQATTDALSNGTTPIPATKQVTLTEAAETTKEETPVKSVEPVQTSTESILETNKEETETKKSELELGSDNQMEKTEVEDNDNQSQELEKTATGDTDNDEIVKPKTGTEVKKQFLERSNSKGVVARSRKPLKKFEAKNRTSDNAKSLKGRQKKMDSLKKRALDAKAAAESSRNELNEGEDVEGVQGAAEMQSQDVLLACVKMTQAVQKLYKSSGGKEDSRVGFERWRMHAESGLNDESPDSSPSKGDPVLSWKDGVGALPGIDAKFHINEFGVFELIPSPSEKDEEEIDSTTVTVGVQPQNLKQNDTHSNSLPIQNGNAQNSKILSGNQQEQNEDATPVAFCRKCSEFGAANEFIEGFCSACRSDLPSTKVPSQRRQLRQSSTEAKLRVRGLGVAGVDESMSNVAMSVAMRRMFQEDGSNGGYNAEDDSNLGSSPSSADSGNGSEKGCTGPGVPMFYAGAGNNTENIFGGSLEEDGEDSEGNDGSSSSDGEDGNGTAGDKSAPIPPGYARKVGGFQSAESSSSASKGQGQEQIYCPPTGSSERMSPPESSRSSSLPANIPEIPKKKAAAKRSVSTESTDVNTTTPPSSRTSRSASSSLEDGKVDAVGKKSKVARKDKDKAGGPQMKKPKMARLTRSAIRESPEKKSGEKKERKKSFEKVLKSKLEKTSQGQRVAGESSPTKGDGGGEGEDSTAGTTSPENSSRKYGVSTNEHNWMKYLTETKTRPVPSRFFRQPAFPGPNPFRKGMMMEAIDPQHQSLFCVARVVETQGYRLRVRIVGFSESYDFWVNANSDEIFPCGWCEENGQELQTPPGVQDFSWHQYLVEQQSPAADRSFFVISREDPLAETQVRVGMKLEAADIRNQKSVCVASVALVIGERFLVHFDSWDPMYDYWTDLTSPYIHPVGWCERENVPLLAPNSSAVKKTPFSWDKYLRDTKSVAMPQRLFQPLPPVAFKPGMKLECVDKRNPFLIRVATITHVSNHEVGIHFDGWSDIYDYDVYELSPDLHPVAYCSQTGHALQSPPTPVEQSPWTGPCPTFGCIGLGHIKGPKFLTHNTDKNCPYATHNFLKEWPLTDRLVAYEKNCGMERRMEADEVAIKMKEILPKKKSKASTGFATCSIVPHHILFPDIPAKRPRRESPTPSNSSADKPPPLKKPSQAKPRETKTSMRVSANEREIEESPPKLTPEPRIIPTTTTTTTATKKERVKLTPEQKKAASAEKRRLNRAAINAASPPKKSGTKNQTDKRSVPKKLKSPSASTSGSPPRRRSTGSSTNPSGIILPPKLNFKDYQEGLTESKVLELSNSLLKTTLESVSVKKPIPMPASPQKIFARVFNPPKPIVLTPSKLTLPMSQQFGSAFTAPKHRSEGMPTTMSYAAAAAGVTSMPNSPAYDSCLAVIPMAIAGPSFPSPLSMNIEHDLDLPNNMSTNISPLKKIVGDLSPGIVSTWSMHDVKNFVTHIPGCFNVAKRFAEQMIDGEALLLLNQGDLIEILGFGMGPAIKLAHVVRLIHLNARNFN